MMTQGHYAPKRSGLNEAWGLDLNGDNRITSCSEDGTLRVFNTVTHEMEWYADMNLDIDGKRIPDDASTKDLSSAAQAKAVAACPEKNVLAVAMVDGSMRIYQSGKLVFKKKVSKEWSQDIKFSPDNNLLVLSSHDNKLYKFDLSGGFENL